MRSDFCVFILTHGRPDCQKTYQALKDGNYTGKVYFVIDNEDDKAEQYRKAYGDKIIMFDKKAQSLKFDTADLSQDRRTIVYARNACFDLAQQVGVRFFLELDDDYTSFESRKLVDGKLAHIKIKDLDSLFGYMLDFLQKSKALSVCMAQGGDFIGGTGSAMYRKRLSRKAMNTFFCDTKNPFNFVGRINEDVNTYTSMGRRGGLLLSVADCDIQQTETQKSKGGMTDIYLNNGTYVKSFYTVMFCPSAVKISVMGFTHKRIHHRIDWNACSPCILDQKWRKK